MFRFVAREKANYRVTRMCRVLGVSPSGYSTMPGVNVFQLNERGETLNCWSGSRLSIPKAVASTVLLVSMPNCSAGTRLPAPGSGSLGLCGRRVWSVSTARRTRGSTKRDPVRPSYADLVKREFAPDIPDRLWVAERPLRAGFIWRSSSTPTPGKWSVGRWLKTYKPNS